MNCLGDSEISGLAAGELSADAAAFALRHVDSCPHCRGKLDAMVSDGKLFASIRHAFAEGDTNAATRHLTSRAPSDDATYTPIIEGYDILSPLGAGGQGVVYRATQLSTKRPVALKVLLHTAHLSERHLERFQREIEIIAGFQHPNIVRVYDCGLTQTGQRYYAMEYIDGRLLSAHIATAPMTLTKKLTLFQKICSAVNHAHQRGVLHRDLKPGNILIDNDGEPHVLDFGLAKAIGEEVSGAGHRATVTGEFLGTLAYASPEQAAGDPSRVDVRTDVYSLGVILYEMLTGHYPYPVVGRIADVLHHIAESEPRKPSTWRTTPESKGPRSGATFDRINDELETIILKALAKEPERRYQFAGSLAVDIEHYLKGQPIDAKRDSAWYLIRKLAARNRYATVGLLAVFMAIASAGYIGLFS